MSEMWFTTHSNTSNNQSTNLQNCCTDANPVAKFLDREDLRSGHPAQYLINMSHGPSAQPQVNLSLSRRKFQPLTEKGCTIASKLTKKSNTHIYCKKLFWLPCIAYSMPPPLSSLTVHFPREIKYTIRGDSYICTHTGTLKQENIGIICLRRKTLRHLLQEETLGHLLQEENVGTFVTGGDIGTFVTGGKL
jgi:hypothetical protein